MFSHTWQNAIRIPLEGLRRVRASIGHSYGVSMRDGRCQYSAECFDHHCSGEHKIRPFWGSGHSESEGHCCQGWWPGDRVWEGRCGWRHHDGRPEALVLDSLRATSVWCQGLGARARGRRVSLTTKSSSLWWLRSSVCILSSSTEGDAPSAEGAEVYEVKGHCCLLQQCQIWLAHS